MSEDDFEVHPSGTYSMISEDSLKMLALANLLRMAKCPDDDCIDGSVPAGPDPDGVWSATQCQFCSERKAVLKEFDGGSIFDVREVTDDT